MCEKASDGNGAANKMGKNTNRKKLKNTCKK